MVLYNFCARKLEQIIVSCDETLKLIAYSLIKETIKSPGMFC